MPEGPISGIGLWNYIPIITQQYLENNWQSIHGYNGKPTMMLQCPNGPTKTIHTCSIFAPIHFQCCQGFWPKLISSWKNMTTSLPPLPTWWRSSCGHLTPWLPWSAPCPKHYLLLCKEMWFINHHPSVPNTSATYPEYITTLSHTCADSTLLLWHESLPTTFGHLKYP